MIRLKRTMAETQIIMMIASKAVSISITRLSPKPSPLMMSACVLSMASCVVVPAEMSPTRFPMEVKKQASRDNP